MDEADAKEWFLTHHYLDRETFLKIARWKSPRPIKHYLSKYNDDQTLKELSDYCFNTKNELLRIELLQVIHGVSYPLASAILHFAFPDQYPIMDFRAIWSIGWEKPKHYDFDYWSAYCDRIRLIAKDTGLPIRTVDKALWQYSKDNQPAK